MSGAPPRRVVIDPNLFISATITPNGALGPIIGLIDDGTLVPVVSQHLVDEVVDVLGRPKLAKYVKPGAGAAFARISSRTSWPSTSWHGMKARRTTSRPGRDDHVQRDRRPRTSCGSKTSGQLRRGRR